MNGDHVSDRDAQHPSSDDAEGVEEAAPGGPDTTDDDGAPVDNPSGG